MSELSDQVAEYLFSLGDELVSKGDGKLDAHGGVEVNLDRTGLADYPGFEARRSYTGWNIARHVRRVVRLHGGKEWETLGDAMDDVFPDMLNVMVPVTLATLADGYQLGRKPTPVIKKYTKMHDLENLFMSTAFRTDSDLQALAFMQDADLFQGIRRYITNVTWVTGGAIGARRDASSLIPVDHVFDLWMHCMMSVSLGIYISGVKLGQKHEENELLDGILSASTTNEEKNT